MGKFTLFKGFNTLCRAMFLLLFLGIGQAYAQDSLCFSLNASINSFPAAGQGQCDGSATVIATGGTPPYSYMWDNDAMVPNRTNLCSGGYYVNVTDARGCIFTADVFIPVKPDPCVGFSANITPVPTSGQGMCDGRANVIVNGGMPPFIFHWGDSANTKDRFNLCSMNYFVNIQDSRGCYTATEAFVGVQQDTATNTCGGFHASINSFPATEQGKCDGSANAVVSGGTAPYSYMWGDSAFGPNRPNLCSGGYYVNVTDANGCTSIADIFISVKPDPCSSFTVHITPTPTSGQGRCDGNANIIVNGGAFPFTFQWGDSANTKDRNNLCSKDYFVNVQDSRGCFTTAQVFIGVNQDTVNSCGGFNAAIRPTPVSAQGTCDGSASVDVFGGSSPFQFMWLDSANTKDRFNICSNGYMVTVIDSKGCSANAEVFIGVKPAPIDSCLGFRGYAIATPVSAPGNCDGFVQVEILGGTKPFSGFWNNTNEIIPNGEKSGLCSNPYTILLKDSKGCSIHLQTFVGVRRDSSVAPENPCLSLKANIAIKPVTLVSACNGGAEAMVSGGTIPYIYSWSDSASTKARINLCSASYSVKVTDAKGCVFYTKGFVGVRQDTTTGNPCLNFKAIVATIPVSSNTRCDGSAKVVINGGLAPYNVMWSDFLPLKDRSGVCPGTYTVEVKDAKGCISKASGIVGVSATNPCVNFSSTITSTPKTSKCDGSAYVTVAGGTAPFKFGWSNYISGPMASNLCPGIYSVVVKDINGCMSEAKTRIAYDSTIAAPATPPLALRIKTQGTSGANTCDGYAAALATGGIPPYSIKFSNGVNTNENYPLCAGVYSVIVYDSKGNFDSLRFVVSSPEKTLERVATALKDSVPIATSFANAVTDCSLNFTNIDSIKIKEHNFSIAKDSLIVTWNIFIHNNSFKTIYRTYPIGQSGIYKFILDLYCGGGVAFKQASTQVSSGDYFQGTETINVQEEVVTSITTVEQAAVLFNLYPNPVISTLNISVDVSNYSIEVKDLLGRTVMNVTANTNNYTVNMENLPHGLYFVIIQADKFQKTVKVIKE